MKHAALFFSTFCWVFVCFQFRTIISGETNEILVEFAPNIPVKNQMKVLLSTVELLNETSSVLQKSTNLPLKSVTLLVPNSWNFDNSEELKAFGKVRYANLLQKTSDAQVFIDASTAFELPVSIQHQGCGQQGRRVILPSSFLLINGTGTVDKGKLLAKEWIKFKYGVFDENGFPNDPRFPEYYRLPGDNVVKFTHCADVPIKYTIWDSNQQSCNLPVHENSGLPVENSNCSFDINPKLNTKVRSSFLDGNVLGLENVDTICDNNHHPHNKFSPNKQNLFCRGKSVFEILKQHPDFKKQTKSSINFNIVKKPNARIILAVDNSEGLRSQEILLKNAIRTMVRSLPDRSEFGIIKFTDKASLDLNLTLIINETTRQDIATKKISLKLKGKDVNPRLAIETAIGGLTKADDPQTGSIIVVSSVAPERSKLNDSMIQKLKHLCLIAITFDGDIADKFKEFLQENDCNACSKVINVTGSGFPAFQTLIDTFNTVIVNELIGETSILVKGKKFSTNVPLSFYIDNSVESFAILLSNEESNMRIDKNEIEIFQDDISVLTDNVNVIATDPLVIFRAESKQTSKWTVRLTPKEEEYKEVSAQVITKQRNKFEQGPKVKVWTHTGESSEDNYQGPIILYAEVLYGSYPIINAQVMAKITSPEGQEEVIELYDNGLGDPDITQNDGIYARYFIQFSTLGEYKVEITVENNGTLAKFGYKSDFTICCGSELKFKKKKPTGLFSIAADTSFIISKEKPKLGFKPGQIQDLRVFQTSEPLTYTFQWTAPGNEADHGTVEHYFLKIFSTQEGAYTLTNQVKELNLNNLITPKSYGESQSVNISFSDELTTMYIILKSKNNKGHESKPSNIVNIVLVRGKTEVETSTQPITQAPLLSEPGKIGIAVGSFLFIVLLVAVGFLIIYFRSKKKQKKEDADIENQPKLKLSSLSDTLSSHDGNIKPNERIINSDPINPVNSIPANVLLDHHEQVKDAKTNHKDPPLFTAEKLYSYEKGTSTETSSSDAKDGDNDSQIYEYGEINHTSDNKQPNNKDSQSNETAIYAKPHKRKQTDV